MLKILITGAKGQLGSEIHDIAPHYPFLFRFTDIHQLDILHYDSLDKYFAEQKIQYCINAAAYTAVDNSEKEKLRAYEVNVAGASNLAKVCKKHNAHLIHISTDFVFGGECNTPYSEDATPNPLGIYGVSKLQGENEVLLHNPETILIRTAWLYSQHGSNFVKTMLRLAQEKGHLKVVYDQIGSPTYARDLAAVLLDIISILAEKNNEDIEKMWGIYHYTNDGVASWYDFAHAIMEYAGLLATIEPIRTYEFPTSAVRPAYSVLDKSKIKKTFGIKIPHWRESLRESISTIMNA